MNEKRLHQNLERWSSSHPREALLLPYQEDPSLSFCKTRKGEWNLQRLQRNKRNYYHANSGAVQEAEKWVEQLSLNDKDVVYVFGIGLGYYYEALKPWLKKKRRRSVVFLENDLAVIKCFFQTEMASHFLKDPQASLYYFTDLHGDVELFNTMYWNYVLTQMEVSALKLYEKTQSTLTQELHHKIIYDASVKNALVEEYLKFGANFFKNFYANQLYLADSYLGNRMFGQLKGIPAIICGAGPSLQKSLPLLAALKNHGLIFAGGSSLNALTNAHLLPHFGAGIDPNLTQLERLLTSSGFEVPFFYRNRLLHQAFRKIHGPKLYITGSGGYDIADWFEEELGIQYEEYLDEGHNVVNFCLQIAYHLGCNPIIFVGMDLGFTGNKTYAAGIEKNVKLSSDFEEERLLRKDIYGKPLYTLWKWIAEADWIGDFAKEHPEVTLLNCTEGGLGFPGVEELPLKEASERYLRHSFDLHSRVQAEIQVSTMPQVTQDRVNELIQTMYDSLKSCIGHFNVLIEETEKMRQRIRSENAVPAIIQSGLAALAETELSEEVAYKAVLEIFNQVYTRVLNRDVRHIRMSCTSEAKRALRRLAINIKRLKFLKDVARVNIGVIELAWRAKELGDMPTLKMLRKKRSIDSSLNEV